MIDEQRLYLAVGGRLRALREQRPGSRGRLTQAELAKQVGLERTSITNIEKGAQKVPLHVLFRIGEALGVAVVDLLPAITDVQSATVATEEIVVGDQVQKVSPMVKQVLTSLLKQSS